MGRWTGSQAAAAGDLGSGREDSFKKVAQMNHAIFDADEILAKVTGKTPRFGLGGGNAEMSLKGDTADLSLTRKTQLVNDFMQK